MSTTTTGNLTDYGATRVAADVLARVATLHLMSVAGGETAGGGTEFDAVDYAAADPTSAFAVDPLDTTRFLNSEAAIVWGTPASNWGTAVEIRGRNADGYDECYWTISPGIECEEGAPVRVPVDGLTQAFQ